MQRRTPAVLVGLILALAFVGAVQAQSVDRTDSADAPRFLRSPGPSRAPVRITPGQEQGLQRLISLDLNGVTLRDALRAIADESGIRLMYSSTVAPLDRRVSIQASDVTVAEALRQVLRGLDVDVMVTGADRMALVRRAEPVREEVARVDTGTIVGRVTAADSGEPLTGAQVVLDGRREVVTTGEGVFIIGRVAAGEHLLEASLIGYRSDTVTVIVQSGRSANASISLEISPAQLDQLVVTATGEERRLLEIGNDITVLNADSIVAREPISSVADLLEGRVPGLVVQRSTGTPGDPTRIRIRGASSPNLSNDPIIVVDGIRVYSAQSDMRGGNLAQEVDPARYQAGLEEDRYNAPSPLDYMDPSMIESIQVVKGPSAATMYGQDAANGVIVITTKKGQPGRTRWTVSADHGVTQLRGDYPQRYVRFGRSLIDDRRVVCPVNGWLGGNPAIREACLPDDSVMAFQTLNDPYLTVLDRGQTTALSLGVSGGAAGLTYSVNGSYRDEIGIVKLSRYEADLFEAQNGTPPFDWMQRPQNFTQWGVQSRVQAQVGSDMTVSLSSHLSNTEQQRSELERTYAQLDSIYVDPVTGLYYDVGGVGIGGLSATLAPVDARSGFYERATATATRFTNALNLNWRARSWLTIAADAGLSVDQREDAVFIPAGFDMSNPRRADGDLSRGQGTAVTSTVNLRTSSQAPLGRGFSLRLATGVNYTGQSIEDVRLRAEELAEGVSSITGSTSTINGSENRRRDATFGLYVEPGLAHRRMWLNFGLRLDGGSSFGSDVELPVFPKVSFSYLISDEPFFPEVLRSTFDQLRLRLAYGHAGRQPGPTDRLRLYSSAEVEPIGGVPVEIVDLQTLGNMEVKPERSQEFEGGFDAALFDHRLSLSVTTFRKTTRDALLDVPVAPSVYGEDVRQLQNIGVIRNAGLELAVDVEPVRTDFVTWRLGVNFSQNRNEVLELGEGVEPFFTQQARTFQGARITGMHGIRVAAGYPLFGRWSTPVLGYDDANENGLLEANEVVFGDTAVYVGGTLPEYEAGVQTSLSLFRGALAVSAALTYSDGLTQYNRAYNPALARGWHDPSATSLLDQLRFYDSTRFTRIETVNSVRLNSVSVAWQVPAVWAGQLGADALTLSLQGTNLGLWTNYSGMDPNVNSAVGGNHVLDGGALPTPQSFQLRLSATY